MEAVADRTMPENVLHFLKVVPYLKAHRNMAHGGNYRLMQVTSVIPRTSSSSSRAPKA